MELLEEQRENISFVGKLGKLSENDFQRILNKLENNDLDKKNAGYGMGHHNIKQAKGINMDVFGLIKIMFKYIE
jgi:hypothetical protein